MLYLEDYVEVIEHLPQELRDRFTELRELDLQVQNSFDALDDRVETFFNKRKVSPPAKNEMDPEYDDIRKEYSKILEDADEKVNISSQMYELVERYLRRLDQEIYKFKMELEADNAGITEILEKRSLEMDQPQGNSNSSQKENYKNFSLQRKKTNAVPHVNVIEKKIPEKSQSIERSPTTSQSSSSSNVSYTLGHMGAGGNAIAAAASQAIAATQQMQQGRRTASLKASYEAVNLGVHTQEFSIGKELAGAAQSAIAATQEVTKKQVKKKQIVPCVPVEVPLVIPRVETPEEVPMDTSASDQVDWTYDPNEQKYCLCNQVSYGDMVACDNPTCVIEWFHYPCVGIEQPPKGKWFCPKCIAAGATKRRGNRK